MRIAVDHRTRYRFAKPQSRLVQMLRVTPQDSADQTVVNWHIGVDCDARLRDARDGYGNRVTMIYADGPLEGIEIAVQGEVLTAGDAGVVRGFAEPLPPLLFCRATDRTTASAEMLAFAAEAGGDGLARLHAVNLAITRHFQHRDQPPDDGLGADEVFARGVGSPRDLAHVFLAVVRADGTPARYVSGYRPSGDGAGHAPHAWAEAYVDDLGWVAFDPSRGISADASYVRLAVALDALGAAPVAGSRLGEGPERLDVELQVKGGAD